MYYAISPPGSPIYSPPPSPHYGNSYVYELQNWAIKKIGNLNNSNSNNNNVNLSRKNKSKKNVLKILKYSRSQIKKKTKPKRKLPQCISLNELMEQVTRIKNLKLH